MLYCNVCTLYCSICTSTCTLYCSVRVYSIFKNFILQARASIFNLPLLTVDCIYLSYISRLQVVRHGGCYGLGLAGMGTADNGSSINQ